MLDLIQQRLRAGAWVFLVGPPVVLFLILSIALARARLAAHDAKFAADAHEARAQLEALLSAEAARLVTLSRMPAAAMVAQSAQRRDALRSDDEARMESSWERAARDDLLVRSVLDNDVAILFRRLQERDVHLSEMILTDARGVVLAAPEKTARYSQRTTAWWPLARHSGPGVVASPGIDAMGRLDMGTCVMRPDRQSVVDGVIHVRVNLAPLAERAGLRSSRDRVLLVLGGDAPWVIGGVTNAGPRAAIFADKLHLRAGQTGHVEGYRYRTVPVSGGITWTNQVRLIVGVSEGEVPLGVFLPAAVLFAVGAGVMIGLAYFVPAWAQRTILEPLREPAEAGVWALRTAFGRGTVGGRSSPIQKELAAWFGKLQQELQRQSATISADVARDLELATEFQQAFLNRPYPEIPEVHLPGRLRLEFYHRYQPALAMGGDFFDITAVADDCAGVFVGDVMGHGTRSALIVAMLRTLIAEQSRRARNAPHFLRELNTEFCKLLAALPQPFFASATYFVADTTSRIATYSVAGHPPPFYLHRAVGRVARLELPRPHGVALGLVPGEEFGGGTVRLNDGDAFIFFTDGVYEAANVQGEEFGLLRLEKILRTNVYHNSREIIDAVMDAILHFVGEQPIADDICLVAVDVRTDARGSRAP